MSEETTKRQQVFRALLTGERRVSFSSLSRFAVSPDHMARYYIDPRETSDAMTEGTYLHALTFQPEKVEEEFFVIDDREKIKEIGGKNPRATNKYKEWYLEKLGESGGKEIVELKTAWEMRHLANRIRRNSPARHLIEQCTEFETRSEWSYMGFKFVGFIDGKGDKIIIDLKLCPDAEPGKFQRNDIISKKLYLQAAMYRKAELLRTGELKDFYNIAVDRSGAVSVIKYDKRLLQYGDEEYSRLCSELERCIAGEYYYESYNFFCPRRDGVFVAELPKWLY